MTSPLSSRRRSKTPPPGETGQEGLYLRSLSDRQVIVNIKLRDGETVRGWIEYFDDSMLRLTREIHTLEGGRLSGRASISQSVSA